MGSPQQLHENACKEHIGMSAAENDVVQVEGDRPEAKKKKRGACKKTPLDAAEEDGWVRKSVDELAQESEDDVISNSEGADDDSGRQRDVDGDADLEGAEDSPTPKKTQKRGQSKKGKTPVQKRTSVSRVTRSGSNKKPIAR